MTAPHQKPDSTCQLIITDLTENRRWDSAVQITLFDTQVVAARELVYSPLVVFIPLGGNVKLTEMTLILNRVRQLGLDLSTGEVTIERHPESEVDTRMKNDVEAIDGRPASSKVCSMETASSWSTDITPDIFKPLPASSDCRFKRDDSFDRDTCLRLHREVTEKQFDFELAKEAEDRKRAREEEIRLGLVPDETHLDKDMVIEQFKNDISTACSTFDQSLSENTQSSGHELNFDPTVDIHISAMFAFTEGGTLCYYQATLGLAPPQFCPDDSDDEKPLDQVQQEQKKTQNKRKNME